MIRHIGISLFLFMIIAGVFRRLFMSPELLLFDITVLFNWSACKAWKKRKVFMITEFSR